MDAIMEMVSRGVEQLLGRASGPLHLRLVIMPIVVTVFAVRAGLKDAREGRAPFMWAVLTNSADRPQLFRSTLKDIGKIFIVAVVLDTVYQVLVLRAYYVIQMLIVAVACAIVPYALVRGPVTRLMRGYYRRQAGPSTYSGGNSA